MEKKFPKEEEFLNLCFKGSLLKPIRKFEKLEPKVSIIIPVYNGKKYLLTSVRSIQNQTLEEIEIIMVDDGSTDGSVSMIKELQASDQRIKLIQNEVNRGILYTRSKGSLNAKGKYIAHVDQDDCFCNSDIIESAYNLAESTGAEIVQFIVLFGTSNHCLYSLERYIPVIYELETDKKFLQNAIFKSYNENKKFIHATTCWSKLFSTNLIKKALELITEEIYSNHIIYSEDHLLMYAIFNQTNSFIGLKKYGYYHHNNPEGASTGFFDIGKDGNNDKRTEKMLSDTLFICNTIFKLTSNDFEGKKIAFNACKFLWTENCIRALKSSSKFEDYKLLVSNFLKSEYVSEQDKEFIKKNVMSKLD